MEQSNAMSDIKIKVKHFGVSTENYLYNLSRIFTQETLKKIGDESIDDFIKASPTVEIASSWTYNIKRNGRNYTLSFENSTYDNGENIAILIDIGHGTSSGRWVPGKNYLREPIRKVYERINKLLTEAHDER